MDGQSSLQTLVVSTGVKGTEKALDKDMKNKDETYAKPLSSFCFAETGFFVCGMRP